MACLVSSRNSSLQLQVCSAPLWLVCTDCTDIGLEPSVTDNGLPSFKIQLVEAKSNDKQNAPAKPTNNAKATSAQAPAPVLAGSGPAPVLAESGSSTAVGSVDAERISRVAPKPRTRRGKANDASACPAPSEQAGSALPSTSTTTTPFPDLVHYGPNDGVQPFLNVRQPSAAAGVDDVQPVAPTFFNIDPSLLTELSTPYGSSARVPPPSAQIPGTRSSGSAHHHPTAAGPTPIIDLNAASVVAQPPTSTVLPSGIPFPVAVFPSHQQQVDVRQIEHHPLPSPGMLSSANGEATDTDASTTANSKPTAIITPIDTPNVDDAPILIQDQLQRFSKTAVPASVIVPWTRLLQDWVELERMRKYESKVSTRTLLSWQDADKRSSGLGCAREAAPELSPGGSSLRARAASNLQSCRPKIMSSNGTRGGRA